MVVASHKARSRALGWDPNQRRNKPCCWLLGPQYQIISSEEILQIIQRLKEMVVQFRRVLPDSSRM